MPSSSPRPEKDPYLQSEAPRPRTHARASKHSFLVPLFLIAFVASASVGAYYFVQYHRLKNDPSLEARKEAEKVVKELSKVMVVPDEEAPILATVSDRDQLQDQPFFRNAQNGDQVIIFPSSMKAVLYRPSEKRIVDIAPLTADAPAADAPMPVAEEPSEEPAAEGEAEIRIEDAP